MNARQLAEIRRQLIAEREHIIAEWKNHGGDSGSADDWDSRDPEERAIQISSDTVDRKIADDDRNLLEKINFALHRLDHGTYCICANCATPIPDARLLAKPSASLCIACQELKDATNT